MTVPSLFAAVERVPGVVRIARVGWDDDRLAGAARALGVGRAGLAVLQLAGGLPAGGAAQMFLPLQACSPTSSTVPFDRQARSGAVRLIAAEAGAVAGLVAADAVDAVQRHAVSRLGARLAILAVALALTVAGVRAVAVAVV